MVELTLRSLFESSCKLLPANWYAAQEAIDANNPPTEEHELYIRGIFKVWENLLKRLCDGCLGKDSEVIFRQWLGDYKKHLREAWTKDEEASFYLRGQVDAFNSFVGAYSRLSQVSSEMYQKKMNEILQKQKELETLQGEFENLIWTFPADEVAK